MKRLDIGSCENLNLDIATNVTCVPEPCPEGASSYRGFSYDKEAADGASTLVAGWLSRWGVAEGSVTFVDYPRCGTVRGISWAATKR